MYLDSYRVSIAAASVRCLTYILVVPSHRTSRQYQSGRRSAVWPSSFSLTVPIYAIVFALADDDDDDDDDDEMSIHGTDEKKKKNDEDILEQARTDR
jgi:hypothetical protein